MTQGSMIDRIYRSLVLSKYFTKGWGSPKDIKRLLEFRKIVRDRTKCVNLVPEDYPVEIRLDKIKGGVRIIEGKFRTPFDLYLPELLPEVVKDCHFQMILPPEWREPSYKPVCIHMAATGDHFYWRRRNVMAKPLLREADIASVLVQNPFYGDRKPVHQKRSILNNVLDIFTMGGCLMMEGAILHQWLKKRGYGPIGFTGYSMGGHMASLAATSIPEPVVLVPCLSWSTASGVFTEGVMSKAIDWKLLRSQYKENESFRLDIQNMIDSLSQDAFKAGKKFMKNYAEGGIKLKREEIDRMMLTPPLERKNKTDNGAEKPMNISQWQEKYKNLVNNNNKLHESDLGHYEERFELLKRLNSMIFSKSTTGPVDWEQHEAFHFMKGIMDECTHLANFSKPVDPSLIIAVCALDDEYVPRGGVTHLHDIWPEAEVRYVEGGHVMAFVLHQKEFRQAVIDAFNRYRSKYMS